jgi:hypothetical protein
MEETVALEAPKAGESMRLCADLALQGDHWSSKVRTKADFSTKNPRIMGKMRQFNAFSTHF